MEKQSGRKLASAHPQKGAQDAAFQEPRVSTKVPFHPRRVLRVKFCKGRSFGLGLGGLAELGFLVFFEIVHVEVAVGLEPVFMGFDGEGSDEATAGG
jgi:hypothetical protein